MTPPEPTPGRPDMPDGYGIARDGSGAEFLSWVQIIQWLERSRNYWIISTNPDGSPHAIPVWGLWFDDAVVFSTSRQSRKGRNLAERPRVVVHLESGDEVVILYGTVDEMSDGDQLERFADAYNDKYDIRPDPYEAGSVTYRLRPTKALTWLEHDFPNTATRWKF